MQVPASGYKILAVLGVARIGVPGVSRRAILPYIY
jgi:hypothetical protein